ncbi:Cell division cycle protein 23 [Amphibalanus amphitrite]|uniref:Cell division cycle protein 23 n=1 Tax=Amphibalanus amphitrite TaxID=1232801 RepID=A0A6A4VRE9_AMPAM|nr:Cell division cycle protein 23 [Amphibalanus amphitrite]
MATKAALGMELNLSAMKKDLQTIRTLCRQRYLRHCSKWCGEMLMALQDVNEDPQEPLCESPAGGDGDGFISYLYGVVLRRLELRAPAVRALTDAVRRQPLLWQAWLELAALVTDREMLARLQLP